MVVAAQEVVQVEDDEEAEEVAERRDWVRTEGRAGGGGAESDAPDVG